MPRPMAGCVEKRLADDRWVATSRYRLRNGWVAALRVDITELKRREAALRESEERFRALADAAFEAIVVHDYERIVDANQAFLELFGYAFDEVVGIELWRLVSPASQAEAAERFKPPAEPSRADRSALRAGHAAQGRLDLSGRAARQVAALRRQARPGRRDARHLGAQAQRGPHPAAGASRFPDRAAQPLAVPRPARPRRWRRRAATVGRWRCCSSTSTTSRTSTTRSAIRPATPCCAPARAACRASCTTPIPSRASAATSSRSS